MKKNKIFLTGGHGGTTAFATIEKLQKPQLQLFWVGPRYALEGHKALSFEFKQFPKIGVSCLAIRAGRIQRKLTRHSLKSLLKIPLGVWDSFILISKHKPKLVLSFGGFAGFPVCFWAWVFNIPVIIHEQTTAAGLANRLTAIFASRVALSRRSSLKYFKKKKSVVLGNPIRSVILKIQPPKRLSRFPVIFVMGGSRGSQWINNALEPVLPELLSKYKIIHQTGELDYPHFKALKNKLKNKNNYEVYNFLEEQDLKKAYGKAHLVVSRGGANSVAEILALQIPSLLIPIPWAQKDEQTKNAELVVEAGFGRILPQDKLNPQSLESAISDIFAQWQRLKDKATSFRSPDRQAAVALTKLVLQYVS